LLFNANSAIFKLYHGETNLIFHEMMMTTNGKKIQYTVIHFEYPRLRPIQV